MLILFSFIYAYYAIWVLVMPFVDSGHPLHDLFPPSEYAIKIPTMILLIGVSVVTGFTGLVMVRDAT